jgi:starvation-inducible DNA-binding protein
MATPTNTAQEQKLKEHQRRPLSTPTDLTAAATKDISGAMNAILADVFALYLKTKNFHWHLSGPHFREYHLMFDEQGTQLFAMTDEIADRVRKIGGETIKSVGQIARLQRVLDNEADYVEPEDMLAELCEDNKTLAARFREATRHAVQLSPITVKGKLRWKWSVESIMCLGVSKKLEEARVTALEEVFRWLGSPHNYAAFQRLARLTGHEFV